MKGQKAARARWQDPSFQAAHGMELDRIRVERGPLESVALPGLTIGAESPFGLWDVGLYQRLIRCADFSFGLFECAFAESRIEDSIFRGCDFMGSSFQRTAVSRVAFDGSLFEAVSFLDALVVSASFCDSRFKDRRSLGSTFVRAQVLDCDFGGVCFKNTEFRAARLERCNFEGAVFEACDLRGTKFIDSRPSEAQLLRCRVSTP